MKGAFLNEPYCPQLGYVYPRAQDAHMLQVAPDCPVDLSGDYPFLDRSKSFRCKQFWMRVLFHGFAKPLCRIRYALKVEGKLPKALRHKPFVTVCNHVAYWDFIILSCGFPFRNCAYPIWRTNMQNKSNFLYRAVGAIPVPNVQKDGRHAVRRFHDALDTVLNEGRWLHVYPEASMWYYYTPICPFKKTAFALAVEHQVPVVPLTISFRPPKGLYRLFKKDPCCTLHIGAPEYPDPTLGRTDAAEDLSERCRLDMMHMAGIRDAAHNEALMQQYQYQEA